MKIEDFYVVNQIDDELVIFDKKIPVEFEHLGFCIGLQGYFQQIANYRVERCHLKADDEFVRQFLNVLEGRTVEALSFAHNNFGAGQGIKNLPEKLRLHQDLEQLNLSANNLTNNDVPALIQLLQLPQLKKLDISNNPGLQNSLPVLIENIGKSAIVEVDMRNCGMNFNMLGSLWALQNKKSDLYFHIDDQFKQYFPPNILQGQPFVSKKIKRLVDNGTPSHQYFRIKNDAGFSPYLEVMNGSLIFPNQNTYAATFAECNLYTWFGLEKNITNCQISNIHIQNIKLPKGLSAESYNQLYKKLSSELFVFLFEILVVMQPGSSITFQNCDIPTGPFVEIYDSFNRRLKDSKDSNVHESIAGYKDKSLHFHNCTFEPAANEVNAGYILGGFIEILPLNLTTSDDLLLNSIRKKLSMIRDSQRSSDAFARLNKRLAPMPYPANQPPIENSNLLNFTPIVPGTIKPANLNASGSVSSVNLNSITGSVNSTASINSNLSSIESMKLDTNVVNNTNSTTDSRVLSISVGSSSSQSSTNSNKQKMDFLDNLNVNEIVYQEKIGQGGFASVYKAMYQDKLIAVKELSTLTAEAVKDFMVETKLLHGFDHPNVLQVYASFVGADQKPRLMMKYASHGSLYIFIQTSTYGQLDPVKRRELGKQIADGLAYLKEQKVVHGDIKSKNILVDESMNLQIADLGLARVMHTNTMSMTNTRGGGMTPQWAAIELLTNPQAKNTHETDVYSMGVVFWEMLTCRIPFKDYPMIFNLMAYYFSLQGEVFAPGKELSLPDNADPKFADVMRCCLFRDPSKRITAADASVKLAAEPEICELEFFTQNSTFSLEL